MLSLDDQKYLLALMAKLPPDSLKQRDLENWRSTKEYWQLIAFALDNFFAGRNLLNLPKNQLTKADRKFIDILMMSIDQWLKMYVFLSFAWSEIEQSYKNIEMPVSTPRDALKWILTENSTNQMRDKGTFPSRAIHEALTLKNRASSDRCSPEVHEKFNKAIARVAKKTNPNEGDWEAMLFLQTALKIGEKSKFESIRSKVREYRQAESKIHNEIRKWTHPQNKWNNF
ncbi:MAG: hypothetical protein HC763_25960 [Hydrococcus sp. CRU_1_1]|nr:hypothetical protein [Hydrococcus sp. CRU_1_1]